MFTSYQLMVSVEGKPACFECESEHAELSAAIAKAETIDPSRAVEIHKVETVVIWERKPHA